MPTQADSNNFMNLARAVHELGQPFALEVEDAAVMIKVTCSETKHFEAALDLAKARNLQAAPYADGIRLFT